jgi:hypothetical protein
MTQTHTIELLRTIQTLLDLVQKQLESVEEKLYTQNTHMVEQEVLKQERTTPRPHHKTPPSFYTPRRNKGQPIEFEGKTYVSIREACMDTGRSNWWITTYGKRV